MEANLEAIYNYLQLSERIGTSGQPTAEQFAAIRDAGYTLVINLLPEDSESAIMDEPEIVEALGMKYAAIPVVWTAPTLANFARFVETLEANTDQNIFIHCAANMRVSAFCYLYRTLHQKMPHEEAAQDLNRIWVPNIIWQRFINEVTEHYRERPNPRPLP